MHQILEEICVALQDTADAVIAHGGNDTVYSAQYGWNCVSLNRNDLVEMVTSFSAEIRNANIEEIDAKTLKRIEIIPARLGNLISQTIPHLPTSNNTTAGLAYVATIQGLRGLLAPLLTTPPPWETLVENKALPTQLIKKLRSIQATLDEIIPEKEALEAQIKLIQEAHETAESLPIDMKALSEANTKVNKYATDAGITVGKIEDNHKKAIELTDAIIVKSDEADSLVENCEEAYQITTTKGLAAAFDQRAINLGKSMWVWVAGLMIALFIGANVGASRINELNTAIALPDPKAGLIWIQVVLSLLSLGAPIWFAWLATKQIGHRFKLAEDYAFKASVAKAYEGYRKQATKLDPAFEARLFGSALTRLEEAPLRFVEEETHGSPWHEFILSKLTKKNDLNTIVNEGEGLISKVVEPLNTPPAA